MRKKPYIIFNNINSLDIDGVVITQLPLPDTPERRVNKQQVPGRSGDLRIVQSDLYGEDVYESIEKEIKMTYMGDDYDSLKQWLRGTSKLHLSNQKDRYWRASIDNKIPFEKIIKLIGNCTITFSCFPYAFLTNGDVPLEWTPTSNTWKTIIMNKYDLSLPNLKIFGQGDIGMRINGVETDFYSVDQLIECDSELQQCYKGNKNLGINMSGEFPALYPGENVIEFIGNIQKVIITPRWRTL
ncbi:hypothetical protein KYB31_15720 [Clostridium felsineum]|uniref:hypothetical protein n=1 Tax=Clostridium felsineum TaxID=36839 RepID=UPI00214D7D44|nr:hypothetical protein [Clostridium felsineum]MCR3760426.1 hypothetical protein [Clostridium felsineum]